MNFRSGQGIGDSPSSSDHHNQSNPNMQANRQDEPPSGTRYPAPTGASYTRADRERILNNARDQYLAFNHGSYVDGPYRPSLRPNPYNAYNPFAESAYSASAYSHHPNLYNAYAPSTPSVYPGHPNPYRVSQPFLGANSRRATEYADRLHAIDSMLGNAQGMGGAQPLMNEQYRTRPSTNNPIRGGTPGIGVPLPDVLPTGGFEMVDTFTGHEQGQRVRASPLTEPVRPQETRRAVISIPERMKALTLENNAKGKEVKYKDTKGEDVEDKELPLSNRVNMPYDSHQPASNAPHRGAIKGNTDAEELKANMSEIVERIQACKNKHGLPTVSKTPSQKKDPNFGYKADREGAARVLAVQEQWRNKTADKTPQFVVTGNAFAATRHTTQAPLAELERAKKIQEIMSDDWFKTLDISASPDSDSDGFFHTPKYTPPSASAAHPRAIKRDFSPTLNLATPPEPLDASRAADLDNMKKLIADTFAELGYDGYIQLFYLPGRHVDATPEKRAADQFVMVQRRALEALCNMEKVYVEADAAKKLRIRRAVGDLLEEYLPGGPDGHGWLP